MRAVFASLLLLPARPIVGKHAGGGVTVFSLFVRHSEINNHLRLTGIVPLKEFAIEESLFGERGRKIIALDPFFILGIRISCFGVFFQVIHHRMANGIAKTAFSRIRLPSIIIYSISGYAWFNTLSMIFSIVLAELIVGYSNY